MIIDIKKKIKKYAKMKWIYLNEKKKTSKTKEGIYDYEDDDDKDEDIVEHMLRIYHQVIKTLKKLKEMMESKQLIVYIVQLFLKEKHLLIGSMMFLQRTT